MQYLLGVYHHVSFAQDILKLLVSDHALTTAKHVNTTSNMVTFQPGDSVLAKVQVQSQAPDSTVAKLSYSNLGPFIEVACFHRGAYQ